MKKQTRSLVEKAKEFKVSKRSRIPYEYSKENWELLKAFLVGEVKHIQLSKAINFPQPQQAYTWIANGVVDAVNRGKIKLL